jgi:hypothetical protein
VASLAATKALAYFESGSVTEIKGCAIVTGLPQCDEPQLLQPVSSRSPGTNGIKLLHLQFMNFG